MGILKYIWYHWWKGYEKSEYIRGNFEKYNGKYFPTVRVKKYINAEGDEIIETRKDKYGRERLVYEQLMEWYVETDPYSGRKRVYRLHKDVIDALNKEKINEKYDRRKPDRYGYTRGNDGMLPKEYYTGRRVGVPDKAVRRR